MPKNGPTIQELEEGLRIDRNHLEIAAETQPELFYRVSKQLELIISRRDAAEKEIKTIEAKVDQQIRRAHNNSEEKSTEGKIKAEIRVHKLVQAAETEYLALKEEAGQLSALKDAYKQRSYAINNLVELYLGNYYSEVRKEAGEFDRKRMAGRQGRQAMAEGRKRRED